MKKHIIFDLDGTLIDSAPSILEGFHQAFTHLKIQPNVPITPDVVGPPLMDTLKHLAGDDPSVLKKLAEEFKSHYDTEAYKAATVYAGIDLLLKTLMREGLTLYIATNKRDLPTQKIMQYLNWHGVFAGVFALDSYTPPLTSKSLMVRRILADYKINPAEAIYIGDRYEDGLAADDNQIQFVMVTWGYANKTATKLKSDWLSCDDALALERLLIN